MLRLADFDIVFQEVPNETTLALNLSECPNHCPGCHSPQLRTSLGNELTTSMLDTLLAKYPYVTCVALMGGDNDHNAVQSMAKTIHLRGKKVAWYTGMDALPSNWPLIDFDFIKVGSYIANLGGLKSIHTNQRFYKVINGQLEDNTHLFRL